MTVVEGIFAESAHLNALQAEFRAHLADMSENEYRKDTARITSNALLIANGYCPLSFRTVDSIDYKKAMLIFYEQNNLYAFKKIFIEQYEFAVREYF